MALARSAKTQSAGRVSASGSYSNRCASPKLRAAKEFGKKVEGFRERPSFSLVNSETPVTLGQAFARTIKTISPG